MLVEDFFGASMCQKIRVILLYLQQSDAYLPKNNHVYCVSKIPSKLITNLVRSCQKYFSTMFFSIAIGILSTPEATMLPRTFKSKAVMVEEIKDDAD